VNKLLLFGICAVAIFAAALPVADAAGFRGRWADRFGARAGGDAPAPALPNLAYGPDPAQVVDVYVPPRAHAAPVIVMVHGGGWRRGDKALSPATGIKARHYMAKGWLLVAVNYRLLPVPPDQQAADVARALAMVEDRAASWGGDPSQVILMGHSAGGHLVALLSAHPAAWRDMGAKPWAGTVVLDSAAIDLVQVMSGRHARLYDDAFGTDRAYWTRNSPFHQLAADAVPMLIACSTSRADKPCANAAPFVDKGRGMGKDFALLPENKNHGEMNRDVGSDPAYTAAIDRFIARALGRRP
jgi:acetyl esterase/lipase